MVGNEHRVMATRETQLVLEQQKHRRNHGFFYIAKQKFLFNNNSFCFTSNILENMLTLASISKDPYRQWWVLDCLCTTWQSRGHRTSLRRRE